MTTSGTSSELGQRRMGRRRSWASSGWRRISAGPGIVSHQTPESHTRRHNRDFVASPSTTSPRRDLGARSRRTSRKCLCVGGRRRSSRRRSPTGYGAAAQRLRGHDLVGAAARARAGSARLERGDRALVLVPALGAASWISVGLTGPASRWTRRRDRRGRRERPRVVRVRSPRRWRDLGVGAPLAVAGALALSLAPSSSPRA